MDKYLFNDGTNVIQEVQSADELKSLLQSCSDPTRTRVWVFDTNQWLGYADFAKAYNFSFTPVVKMAPVAPVEKKEEVIAKAKKGKTGLKRFLLFVFLLAIGYSVYSITQSSSWEKKETLSVVADRPANSPQVDVDSLVQMIENTRGDKLDRVTKTNFRIRNTWPDKISLKLSADRYSNNITNKYDNIELSVDNSTGYNLDNAIVQLNTWKKNEIAATDTFRFKNIGYVSPMKRKIESSYKGDSISVSFLSIHSKVFNFCYSSEKQSNYGNLNDRWYCRE